MDYLIDSVYVQVLSNPWPRTIIGIKLGGKRMTQRGTGGCDTVSPLLFPARYVTEHFRMPCKYPPFQGD